MSGAQMDPIGQYLAANPRRPLVVIPAQPTRLQQIGAWVEARLPLVARRYIAENRMLAASSALTEHHGQFGDIPSGTTLDERSRLNDEYNRTKAAFNALGGSL